MLLFLQRLYTILITIFHLLFFPARIQFGRKKSTEPKIIRLNRPKPKWVKKEIIKLKALMSDTGCRPIADTSTGSLRRTGK